MFKVQLTRDLRKSILRGHPWIYREAIAAPKASDRACLCEVLDKKGKGLAWGLYSPEGPLAVRVISTQRKPPSTPYFRATMENAYELREPVRSEDTSAYRLFNGEGDGLPGMVCDIYGSVAVLQFDGPHCRQFWDQEMVAQWLLEKSEIKTVYMKPRRSDGDQASVWGDDLADGTVLIKENGVQFFVNIQEGQKTGFFLDQRDNRNHVRRISRNKSVLNLFSYTGGFSTYAGLGGASAVTSVDLSAPAIDLADQSWQRNGLDPSKHSGVAADVFEFIDGADQQWDVVIVDPPSMTHSEKTKQKAISSYTQLFAQAARLVAPGQHLILSSCSSHISSEDFLSIAQESLSLARRTGRMLRVSGQGMDHPFPHACRELQYLKFVHMTLN